MLREGREIFKRLLSKPNGERLILDNYVLKDGTYRLIYMHSDKQWELGTPVDFYYDKKTQTMVGITDVNYRLFQELDYYSKLLEMNKPIDRKKTIHSNNYLTIFVKKDKASNLTKEIIDGYFNVLENPLLKYTKPNAKMLYLETEKQLGKVDVEVLHQIKDYILSHDIFEGIDLDKKDYVKIFFVFDDEAKTKDYYRRESQRYLLCNLFNSNDYNVIDDDKILGLPNDNMGLNGKKPYLEHKTRKNTLPILMSQEEALLQMQLFDFLQSNVSIGKRNVYIDMEKMQIIILSNKELEDGVKVSSGYYLRCEPEKNEVSIVSVKPIVDYDSDLKKSFEISNYMEIPDRFLEKKSFIEYDRPYHSLSEIGALIDVTFFEGKLRNNFWTDSKDISINDGTIKRNLLEHREILSQWLLTGEITGVKQSFDKFSLVLIRNSLEKNRWLDAQRQFNLRWALLNYFDSNDKRGENVMDIRATLRKHINLDRTEDWTFESDHEYNYGIGQMVSYLLTLSNVNDKNHSFVNQFLNASNQKAINDKLVKFYKKYNYKITGHGRGGQLLDHIVTYEPKKIEPEYIMAGFAGSSLIYEKKEEEE